MANAILIPGKEKRVYGGHPWVFRSDIARVEGDFTPGDIVSVYSSKGKFLAKAFYNPQSQISLRIMSLHDEPIDRAFIFRRVKEAVDYRRTMRMCSCDRSSTARRGATIRFCLPRRKRSTSNAASSRFLINTISKFTCAICLRLFRSGVCSLHLA